MNDNQNLDENLVVSERPKSNVQLINLFEKTFINYLVHENGYLLRNYQNFNAETAFDEELVIEFLNKSQSDKLSELNYLKNERDAKIISYIFLEITKRGLLDVLKNGFSINNIHFDLLDEEFNIYSIISSRVIDFIVCINGIGIITVELKAYQEEAFLFQLFDTKYKSHELLEKRIFSFKTGAFVHFVMSLEKVYMTTKICGEKTSFLPFNMGNKDDGAGNPVFKDKFSVSYMWEDLLTKKSVYELIHKFIYISKKYDANNNLIREDIIFPRYHQRDLIHKVEEDVLKNMSSKNYLIQHSTGSGKTNSIAWLAYSLVEIKDKDNYNIFDKSIIVTDRVVIDRQLQATVLGMNHINGYIAVMDDKCTSEDLAYAINSEAKIIVSTIQKFRFIVEILANKKNKNKRYAFLIDEAHSSTSGKSMIAISQAVGSASEDVEDYLAAEIKSFGKQDNISIFAFTATPKPMTLKLFGTKKEENVIEPFHVYSMKQAIEEGFILDVLKNYTTYKTYFEINKKTIDDPFFKTSRAKRKIAKLIDTNEENVVQRTEIIAEHFDKNVKNELGGHAKAMVITSSRINAVNYYFAFKKYIEENHLNFNILVAFTGTVTVNEKDYTEESINGFKSELIPEEFDTDKYQLLIVANKFQTGFDQPKLTALYILKNLHEINIVQTLSRINRICLPYIKNPFILDFNNDYKEIEEAFSKYFKTTVLAKDTFSINSLIDSAKNILSYPSILHPILKEELINEFYKYIAESDKDNAVKVIMDIKEKINETEYLQQYLFYQDIRKFITDYEYALKVTDLEDIQLHKLYKIVKILLESGFYNPVEDFDISDFISIDNFQQKEQGINEFHLLDNTFIQMKQAEQCEANQYSNEDKLSEIIKQINKKYHLLDLSSLSTEDLVHVTNKMLPIQELNTSEVEEDEIYRNELISKLQDFMKELDDILENKK